MSSNVIYTGHPSWRSEMMFQHLLRTVAAVVIGGAIAYLAARFDLTSPVLAALGGVAWIAACVGVLMLVYKQCIYRVTMTNVYKKTGIVNIDKQEYNLRNVVIVQVHQGRLERWITRTGTVEFVTAADHRNIQFGGVPNPDRLAERVRNAQNDLYSGAGQFPVGGMSSGAPAGQRPPAPGSGGGFDLPPR